MAKNKHPYAEILNAIAAGEQIQYYLTALDKWTDEAHPDCALTKIINSCPIKELRVKPKTIRIGDYEVPEPMRDAPEIGSAIWLCNLVTQEVSEYEWSPSMDKVKWLKSGWIQATESGAEDLLKAVLSLVKPKNEKTL
jgi:hypothetical protein